MVLKLKHAFVDYALVSLYYEVNNVEEVSNMLTPNRYMTWEQAVKEYPNSWVVFDENAKTFWGGDPSEGTVIAVCSDDEIDDYRIECRRMNRKIRFNRTSYKTGVGLIDVQGISIRVE